jgi:hypothetical protein
MHYVFIHGMEVSHWRVFGIIYISKKRLEFIEICNFEKGLDVT